MQAANKEMFAMIRKTRLTRPLSAGLIAACMLAMVPAVQAANLPTDRVYVGDLDLRNPQARRELQRRVSRAIERVCRPVAGSALLPRTRRLTSECRADAWAQVQQQLDRHGVAVSIASQPAVSARRN
jgi:UrcA family protein